MLDRVFVPMTVHAFVVGSGLMTLVAGSIWMLIILFLDPVQAGPAGYVLFFLSLFLAVAAGTGLIGYGVRRLVSREQLPAYSVRTALRQGVILGLFLNILLLLTLVRLYQWWLTVILTILFIFAELIFLSYDRSLKRRSNQAST
ncbi:MAG: hypothetical protein WEA04_04380 [Candidatus Andersenbacteria bacterium]